MIRPRRSRSRAEATPAPHGLAEAVALAQAIDLDVRLAEETAIARAHPATLIGKGKLADIGEEIATLGIELMVVDHGLTPIQQRNLESAWHCKVIDRTGLILEIFGDRARTREGRLQVELASLTYQRSRLVRSWTHLERQRGGHGFLGGPGESQLESDRRQIDERVGRVRHDLIQVKRTRDQQRRPRRRADQPVVALVGYTNAGKSTLFHKLTGAGIAGEDRLFATLDPTMRSFDLASGRQVILSDTVGFIADLPTELVAAFRATLEEVLEADLIVHVRDISNPESERQKQDVEAVLKQLDADRPWADDLIEAWNKVDLLDPDRAGAVAAAAERDADSICVSAATGHGLAALLGAIQSRLEADFVRIDVDVPLRDGATIAWLYGHGEVLARYDSDDAAEMSIRLDRVSAARFAHRCRERNLTLTTAGRLIGAIASK